MDSVRWERRELGGGWRRAARVLAAAFAMLVLPVAMGLWPVSPAQAAPSAAQRLADKYSPIVMVRKQTNGICDSSEEQYSPPTSVYSVLGNPKVRLLKTVGRRTRARQARPDGGGRGRTPRKACTSTFPAIRCRPGASTPRTSLR